MGLNANGLIQWNKNYGSTQFEYLSNIFISRSFLKIDSAIYYTACANFKNKQVGVLVKFAFNGDTIWQKIYEDSLNIIVPQMISPSVDGGLLIAGISQSPTDITTAVLIIKTDKNGEELWRKRVLKGGWPDYHDGKNILQDSATKKIVVVGFQKINVNKGFDNILILDSLGNKIEQHSFGNQTYGGAFSMLFNQKTKIL